MCIRDSAVLRHAQRQGLDTRENQERIERRDRWPEIAQSEHCLLYTSDAAAERSSVDLGGRRIIKKKTDRRHGRGQHAYTNK